MTPPRSSAPALGFELPEEGSVSDGAEPVKGVWSTPPRRFRHRDLTDGPADLLGGVDQPITESLVVPFAVKVSEVLVGRLPKRGVPGQYRPVQTLRLKTPQESFGMGVQIGEETEILLVHVEWRTWVEELKP